MFGNLETFQRGAFQTRTFRLAYVSNASKRRAKTLEKSISPKKGSGKNHAINGISQVEQARPKRRACLYLQRAWLLEKSRKSDWLFAETRTASFEVPWRPFFRLPFGLEVTGFSLKRERPRSRSLGGPFSVCLSAWKVLGRRKWGGWECLEGRRPKGIPILPRREAPAAASPACRRCRSRSLLQFAKRSAFQFDHVAVVE